MPDYLRTTNSQILDRKLPELQLAAAVLRSRPAKGWIQALRSGLGMSATVLAQRLGVSHPTVLSYEKAELSGRIQLDTLRRVADALDSELIVALVPRKAIGETLRARAMEIAQQEVSATVQSMRLEDQDVTAADTRAQLELMVENMVREPKKLWR
jgi:predicted DNA-binding mobile mystery protein A